MNEPETRTVQLYEIDDLISFFGLIPNGEGILTLTLGTEGKRCEAKLREKDLKRIFRVMKNFRKERKKVKKISDGEYDLAGLAWDREFAKKAKKDDK